MGKLNQAHALVVMTNGDVYYIDSRAARALELTLTMQQPLFTTTDIKSGKGICLQVANISSIVEGDHDAQR